MYSSQLSMNTAIDKADTPNLVAQKRGFVHYNDFKSKYNRSRLSENSNPSLLKKASINYTQIVENIHPSFKRDLLYIPKRTLTNPREQSKNDGFDNINDDYILRVDDTLGDDAKYQILDLMGQGTFGQVVKCRMKQTNQLVAVKVIKRQPAFLMQGDKEIHVLKMLRDRPNKKDHFLQLQDSFTYKGHTCAVFELLSISLHKLFNQQKKRPNLKIVDIQKISINILETLALLKEMGIIHTDLKPDNILLKSLDDIHDVKLIDYGSALLVTERLNYCVQTAFYRSPEVILHVAFNCAIDMWSFGCFVAEMFLGIPLFPSGNEFTLLKMMATLLNCLPPDDMLKRGKRSNKFFHLQDKTGPRLREPTHTSHDIVIGNSTLSEKIMGFKSYDEDDENSIQEISDRKNLLDFLSKILVFDSALRLDPKQALQHPFITSIQRNPPSVITPVVEHNANETQSLSPANNPSSINTSRTTEDSLDIRTPPNNLHHYMNPIKDDLLLSPSNKSPKITISPPSENKPSVPTKQLKGILKKNPNSNYQQQYIQPPVKQQDNTLDTRVAFLFNESGPHSNTIPFASSYTTAAFTNQFSNPIAATTSNPIQNYQQQQQALLYNNNTGCQAGQPPFITTKSPLLYHTQQQYNIPQQVPIAMYPNRYFSPLQQN